MEIGQFVERALGVPFRDHGRSWESWDCWGLVVVAYEEVCGISLPSYAEQYEATRGRSSLRQMQGIYALERASWERVWVPVAMDVVLLKVLDRPVHVGLVVAPSRGLMIHAEEGANTALERWDRPPWAGAGYDKVEGFYRYVY